MKEDPYRFTDPATMGEVANTTRTYSRHALVDEQGKVMSIDDSEPIQLDIWRHIIDPATGENTGNLKRERMRTLREVYEELRDRLDVVVCEKCGQERRREVDNYSSKCKQTGCDGNAYWFIDEYFSGPTCGDEDDLVPHNFRWVAAFPVTGGNEGHYVHVEFICLPEEFHPKPGEPNVRIVRLALGKTFRGMKHAAEMARRCSIYLGA